MKNSLHTVHLNNTQAIDANSKLTPIQALETGKVIYLPNHAFSLLENEKDALLTDTILDGKHKNISFDYQNQRIGGFRRQSLLSNLLQTFMHRYAEFAKTLIDSLFPRYQQALLWGRTSYRPAEIKGRVSSKRQDDTRLHVDSFPSNPVHGRRILRVFSNIHPHGVPRVWHLGEPFADVLAQFAASIPPYRRIQAQLLYWLKATKTLRSAYDHYQLKLHDNMKLNDEYQQLVKKQRIDFPAQTTWVVFTDVVSHAALSGQYLLEQTFYLPVEAMEEPWHSPLKCWECEKSRV